MSANFIEPAAFGQSLLTELLAGGNNVRDLVEYLKGNVACDYSGVTAMLTHPAVVAALAPLKEAGSPSSLATRVGHTARFSINSDTIDTGATNYFLSGPAAPGDPNTATTYSRSSHPLWFNEVTPSAVGVFCSALSAIGTPLSIKQTGSIGATQSGPDALSGLGRIKDITLPPGTYRLNFVAQLGGYQFIPGDVAQSPNPSSYTFTALPEITGDAIVPLIGQPVDIVIKINGTIPRFITLASCMHYPSDYSKDRSIYLAGATTLYVQQSFQFNLMLQRRHLRGTYTQNSTGVVKNEAIGFKKSVITLPDAQTPTRDSYNYLDITRIA